ncbi:MlaD family protein [Shimia marina]|uniref:Virulence factor Mce family protein n=1 Tax=Shimia marina TaxID=321267 RepID=A0A0P1ELN4_9RHOB|nr:MlaD family protein [Shimia marina]CUH51229.1 virulence factor Mce family protein [Shimia marina]SFD54528.1 phospholipid/cholesterol/gamma-HCH transport system substrate-binding protein [Shimia marina]
METRANYLLIGIFALVGLIGSFGFVLWLAKIDLERQYAYYDVLFDNVSGLGTAGAVRYNGLPVGQVVMLELDDADPSKVRVRIEVAADTPVKTDTIAKLQGQGVTGVSFVALSGGSATAQALPELGEITTEKSALQSVVEGAPELMEKAIGLLENLQGVVSAENTAAVNELLGNLASASGRLDRTLAEFEELSDDVGSAAREIAAFTGRLEQLSDTAEVTLEEATSALGSIKEAAERTEGTLTNAESAFATADGLMQQELKDFITRGADAAAALENVVTVLEPSALSAIQSAQALIEERLPALVQQVQDTAEVIETQVAQVGTDASGLMARYEDVGAQVQARVAQSEAAIASFETATDAATQTLNAVRTASDTATTLMTADIQPLATEATETLSNVRTLATTKVSPLVDQANDTLVSIESGVQALTAQGAEMLETATARLVEARGTLAEFNETLELTDEMMRSLDATADSVTLLIEGGGTEFVADAEAAAESARAALDTIRSTVDENLPSVVADISAAAQSANDMIGNIDALAVSAKGDLDVLSEQGSAALLAATDTFQRSNATLEAIYQAMEAADVTLSTAGETFSGVNRILDEDVDQIVDDIGGAVAAVATAVDSVTGDIEVAASDVRAASASASNLIGTVETVVTQNERQMSEFLRLGLPETVRFVEEARFLVRNLDRLVERIRRDPARFLLGTQGSEFSR